MRASPTPTSAGPAAAAPSSLSASPVLASLPADGGVDHAVGVVAELIRVRHVHAHEPARGRAVLPAHGLPRVGARLARQKAPRGVQILLVLALPLRGVRLPPVPLVPVAPVLPRLLQQVRQVPVRPRLVLG